MEFCYLTTQQPMQYQLNAFWLITDAQRHLLRRALTKTWVAGWCQLPEGVCDRLAPEDSSCDGVGGVEPPGGGGGAVARSVVVVKGGVVLMPFILRTEKSKTRRVRTECDESLTVGAGGGGFLTHGCCVRGQLIHSSKPSLVFLWLRERRKSNQLFVEMSNVWKGSRATVRGAKPGDRMSLCGTVGRLSTDVAGMEDRTFFTSVVIFPEQCVALPPLGFDWFPFEETEPRAQLRQSQSEHVLQCWEKPAQITETSPRRHSTGVSHVRSTTANRSGEVQHGLIFYTCGAPIDRVDNQ